MKTGQAEQSEFRMFYETPELALFGLACGTLSLVAVENVENTGKTCGRICENSGSAKCTAGQFVGLVKM